MSHTRLPVGRLSENEASKARELVQKHGAKAAARMLGPVHERTLRKAALGEPVHNLTLSTLRAKLPGDTL